jgi:hypothetical protein
MLFQSQLRTGFLAFLFTLLFVPAFSQSDFHEITIPGLGNQILLSTDWGDYDQDGDLDLLYTGRTTGNLRKTELLRNDGDRFTAMPTVMPALYSTADAKLVDLDNDNYLDIIVVGCDGHCNAEATVSTTRIFKNDGSGEFAEVAHNLPSTSAISLADFTNDGRIDLELYREDNFQRLYKNAGDFNFVEVPNVPLAGATAWDDFNLDGKLDFARGYAVFKNDGGGSFSRIDVPGFYTNGTSQRYLWADLDGDGDDDFVRNEFGPIWYDPNTGSGGGGSILQVYENMGNGSFVARQILDVVKSFASVVKADMNGDGRIDLLLHGGTFDNNSLPTQIVWNRGNWNFEPEPLNTAIPQAASIISGADVDNDHDIDVLVSGVFMDKTIVLRNDFTPIPALPTPPTNLQSTVAGDGVSLDWDAASDAESAALKYNVYVKRDNVYVITPQADIVSGKPGKPDYANVYANRDLRLDFSTESEGYYTWSVQTVDGETNVSAFAPVHEFTFYKTNGSLPATYLRATLVTSSSITLEWSDQAADETSYTLERSAVSGNDGFVEVVTLPMNSTQFLDNTVQSNVQYFYRVRLNRTGTKALSDVVSVKTLPFLAQAPFNLTAMPTGSSTVHLAWKYSGLNPTGFVVQRSTDNRNHFVAVDTLAALDREFNDTGVEAMRNYYYRVYAIAPGGNSDYSDVVLVSMPAHEFAVATISSLTYDLGASAVLWGDYDNDGFDDVYLTGKAQLYRNKGDGTFEEITSSGLDQDFTGSSVYGAWGDYDNDGNLDLVLISNLGKKLYHSKGNGTFEPIACAFTRDIRNGTDVTWLDIDNDGDLDILLLAFAKSTYFRYDGGNQFTEVDLSANTSSYNASIAAAGDFNDDGLVDLFVGNSGRDRLLINSESALFNDANDSAPVKDNSFDCCTWTPYAQWVDYNNDQKLDLTVIHNSLSSFIYTNRNNKLERAYTFGNGYGMYGGDASWEDFDNDGDLDFFNHHADGPNDKVLENRDGQLKPQPGNFLNQQAFEFPFSWIDYNNDGFRDIITFGNGLKVFKNVDNQNSWIKIKLEGSASNSKGVGAKIFVKANGVWQRKDVTTLHGYHVQQGFEMVFGLHTASVVDSIRVEWPAGSRQTLKAVTARQRITIRESDAQIKPLYKPSNLTGEARLPATITLAWKDNALNEQGFVVQQATNEGLFQDIATVGPNVGTYPVENLVMGTTYHFRIVAVNAEGRSGASNVYTGTLSLFTETDQGQLTRYHFKSTGASWADYNNDGLQDLFVNGQGFDINALYTGASDGFLTKQRELPAGYNTRSGAWGDYNNDGLVDLFLTDGEGSDALFQNAGSGNFNAVQDLPQINASRIGVWGDLNNDGFLDLVVSSDQSLAQFSNQGGNTFVSVATPDLGASPALFALSDIDNDKDLDLTTLGSYDQSIQTWINTNGKFTDVFQKGGVAPATRALCIEDFDEDGDLDFVVVGARGLSFYPFDPITQSYATSVALNDAVGNYTSITAGDFDNNGHLDVLATTPGNGSDVYLNSGGTTFTKRIDMQPGLTAPASVSIADYNNDGALDAFVITADYAYDPAKALYKGTPGVNHWLRVKLTGKESNRGGIGAKVKLFSANGQQLREIRTSTASYSGSEQIAHFGLGDLTSVSYLKIEWPSGRNQWMERPGIDRLHIIEEGQGDAAPVVVPREPMGLDAVLINSDSVALSWQDAANNETSFVLERSLDGGPFKAYQIFPANTTSFVDNGYSKMFSDHDVPLQYRLTAAFEEVQSSYSNVAEVTLPATTAETMEKVITVHPNPANHYLNIETEVPLEDVGIFTPSGLLLLHKTGSGMKSFELNVAQLPDGLYIMKLGTSYGSVSRKITICKSCAIR